MTGRHSFAELRARMSPKAQEEAAAEALHLEAEMDLAEVRRALRMSQEEIAQILHVGQGSIAKMEKRTDMYLSSLRRFIEALGGELEITARFSERRSVKITNFADLAEQREERKSAYAE